MGDFPIDNLRAPDEIRLFRPSRGPKKIFRLLLKFADNEPNLCITDLVVEFLRLKRNRRSGWKIRIEKKAGVVGR